MGGCRAWWCWPAWWWMVLPGAARACERAGSAHLAVKVGQLVKAIEQPPAVGAGDPGGGGQAFRHG